MDIKNDRQRDWRIILSLVVTVATVMTAYIVQAQNQPNKIFLPIVLRDSATSTSPLPDLILANRPSIHPEGVEWDEANGRFLIGSLTQGTVFAVADDGTVTPFATSDNLSMGSVGIHIDKTTNRLLVTHTNPTVLASEEVVGVAQLGIYDLTSGEELHFVDLTELGAPGGRFFANDVTSDADGNAYVTNSLSTTIYKVDKDGNAEIFVNNLGSNGIDYHPDGYLLAAAPQALGLVKIPLDEPTALAPVTLSEPARIDGIVLDANGGLVAVAKTQFGADGSFEDEVLTFKSDDDWATADVVARGVAIPESSPTTVALRDDRAYVVHAHFTELSAGTLVEEFEIKYVEMMAEVMPPDLVLAKQPGMHPEGIEWDEANGRFLVGSLTQGTVFAVADDGTVTPFAASDNLSMGSVGIHIDKTSNRLLVAHSNPNALASEEVAGLAQLGIYDLTSGEELHFVDLTALGAPGGRFFANDVTSDADGNAYVTNSLSTTIYKVDKDGNAEIFVNNLGSNGIDYHPDGYLLAAAPQALGLVKIPLDDPSALAPVTLSEPARMDGIILDANGELVAVAKTNFGADGSFEDEVLTFSSNDSWATATVSARGVAIPESAPTTVTLRDNNAYVVHAHFAELAAGAVVQEFEIQRVLFNEPSESPQDAFLNEEQTDTTADSDLPTDSAELISAFFGLDNGLPLAANRGICEGAGNADGMPVIFSAEIDLETMQVGDFQVTTASGEIGSIECVTLAPAIDEGELRTVLLVGEFGSAEDDPPTSVEIIGNLHSIDQTINFKGATVTVTPLDPGPSMVFAEIVPGEMWNLGRESDGSWGSSNGCPAEGVVQIVRATWDGGVTLKDDEEITNANRDLYKVTVQSADGQTREISPFALGDLDDGDNNHELCLDTADKPISIFFPGGHFTDPNDDLNSETTISIP